MGVGGGDVRVGEHGPVGQPRAQARVEFGHGPGVRRPGPAVPGVPLPAVPVPLVKIPLVKIVHRSSVALGAIGVNPPGRALRHLFVPGPAGAE
ncbi:hypothetical protein GCM10022244_25470 [Streptomyces gulbargensis]|uniref:Uncharacterized protein n=1 Tax=Streptomyces gulbargensis TaxID=364901 RepID=A0ABP7M8I6_9ACTN